MGKRTLSPGAAATIRCAATLARAYGHGFVGSEHLLLAMTVRSTSEAGRILLRAGVTPSLVLQQVEQSLGRGGTGLPLAQGMSLQLQRIIRNAAREAERLLQPQIQEVHLLLAMLREHSCTAARILQKLQMDFEQLFSEAFLGADLKQTPSVQRREVISTKLLDQFSVDLTEEAASLSPVIGRERETMLTLQVLSRKQKNNPVLVGEPGVGKTAIAEGIAQRLARGDVPENLRGKRLLALDMACLIAGTKYRGEFEQRIRDMLEETRRAGDIILFLDEIHTIVGAGSAEGAIDAANILKPALGRGEIQVIGATTTEEYRKYIEKDAALERRFRQIQVEEPTAAETERILRGLRPGLEQHHGVILTDRAIQASVTLSQRYLTDRALPDKAVDLLDEAAAALRISLLRSPESVSERARAALSRELDEAVRTHSYERAAQLQQKMETVSARHGRRGRRKTVTEFEIAQAVSARTGIPVAQLEQEESERLAVLENRLHETIVGQDAAVSAVARAVRRGRSGMADPNRPVGVLLFAGPTGVGKTELCRALAACVYGNRDAMIRLDMSEYMDRFTASRLVGAPPGYVGYGEGGELTEKVRRRPYSLVLLDEIEKAHRDVTNLLLQVMEDGVLHDSVGRQVNFRNTILVMTTNLGAQRRDSVGFLGDSAGRYDAALREYFSPEFLGRIDCVVQFQPLQPPQLQEIARRLLEQTTRRAAQLKVQLRVEDTALAALVRAGCRDGDGARGLRRAVRAMVEEPLSDGLLAGRYHAGDEAVAIAGVNGIQLISAKKRED